MHWLHDISPVLPVSRDPELRDVGMIDTVVLHCTAMPGWNVWETARYHTGPNHICDDGCPTIAYAYFVEPDGLLYRCLDGGIRGWHVGPWNDRSIGVCMAYEGSDAPPPGVQLEVAVEMCAALALQYGLQADRVRGHRELEGTGYVVEDGHEVQCKECPGLAIDMDEFRRQVASAMERPGGPEVREA